MPDLKCQIYQKVSVYVAIVGNFLLAWLGDVIHFMDNHQGTVNGTLGVIALVIQLYFKLKESRKK